MNEVQATRPISQLHFGRNDVQREYIQDIDYELVPDEFSRTETREDIENVRDKKVSELKDTQKDMNDFAESLKQNNNKVTRTLSKGVKIAASLMGLAITFTTAKYGSKVSINMLKKLGKSPVVKDIKKNAKSGFEQLAKLKDTKPVKSMVSSIENTKIAKKMNTFLNKPSVKEITNIFAKSKNEFIKGYNKHITPVKVQAAVENTLAASATASVLVDDLAGRNDDKSNVALAMGASGGDK